MDSPEGSEQEGLRGGGIGIWREVVEITSGEGESIGHREKV
jgi:hypothetical protein